MPRSLLGLADAGLAAASTFAMAAVVLRTATNAGIALYSAMFAAFVIAGLLATQLVCVPSQLAANLQGASRGTPVVPLYRHDIRAGWPVFLASAVVSCVLSVPVSGEAPVVEVLAAFVGLVALTICSPFQNHVRAGLHLVGRHASAAATSVATLIAQVGFTSCWLLIHSHLAPNFVIGVVFAANAAANIVGAAIGLRLAQGLDTATPLRTPWRVRAGMFLAEAVSDFGLYLGIVLTTVLLGRAAVAELEAARVVASPAQVLVAGLLTFATPQAVRLFAREETRTFQRFVLRMGASMLACCAVYAALAVVADRQLSIILNRSVDVDLALARIFVTAIYSCAALYVAALLAQHRVLPVNIVAVLSTAFFVGTVPIGLGLFGVIGMTVCQGLGAVLRGAGLLLLSSRPKGTGARFRNVV